MTPIQEKEWSRLRKYAAAVLCALDSKDNRAYKRYVKRIINYLDKLDELHGISPDTILIRAYYAPDEERSYSLYLKAYHLAQGEGNLPNSIEAAIQINFHWIVIEENFHEGNKWIKVLQRLIEKDKSSVFVEEYESLKVMCLNLRQGRQS